MGRPAVPTVGVFVLVLFISSSTGLIVGAGQISSTTQSGQGASWALGVVAPEGAVLEDGTLLRWEEVGNLTAEMLLPEISRPMGIVYVVVSSMTGDGTVLQAAAGIYPNRTVWYAYSWIVPGVDSSTPSYRWVLNGSGPGMSPDGRVTISIFHSTGSWWLRVYDTGTGWSVTKEFPGALPESLRGGDQEFFALESYTTDLGTFKGMGNLTLVGLYADGKKVVSGVYPYSEWDTVHNPIFVVGSPGTVAPGFISLTLKEGGAVVWAFSDQWSNSLGQLPWLGAGFLALLLTGLVSMAAAIFLARKGRMRNENQKRLFHVCGGFSALST